MYDVIARTYLLAGRIEPGRSLLRMPQRSRRRPRQARGAVGRLLVATGGALQRAGHRLSGTATPAPEIAPQAP